MGSNQLNSAVSKLSGTTRSLASNIFQEPAKMENMLNMVRTFAPLTSAQTVSKVNTYLPAAEKVSTLLGMYSFINRAQNYRPIQALDAKTPVDKITALLKNGNIPVGKLMAQPILANNMDKILGTMAMNMVKNGDISEMLSSLTNGNQDNSEGNKNTSTDLNSLMETFMPMINNIMSSNEKHIEPETNRNEVFKNAQFDYTPIETNENKTVEIPQVEIPKVEMPPSKEKNIKHEQVQKPIRIRQRRR